MSPARPEHRWTVYILRCGDGSLYTGITDRLGARLRAHAVGRGARYTRSRLPVELVWSRGRQTGTDARRLEAALKREPRAVKLRLVDGDVTVWRRLRRTVLAVRERSTAPGPGPRRAAAPARP